MSSDTIPALFARQAADLKQRPLFFFKRGGAYQPITWQQAAEDVLAFGAYLLECNVRPGDRIAILAENRPEWGIADLAIQSVGAWTVPLYPSLTVPDLRIICIDCQPAVCIASNADQVAKLAEVSASVPSIRAIVATDPTTPRVPLVKGWSDALRQGTAAGPNVQALLRQRTEQLRPEDTATLIYTSGTTGEPKGVMLSHRNFLSNVQASLSVIPVQRSDLHLSFLPLSHVFERMAGWYLMLTVGAAIAYAESMDTIPQNMLEVRPTIMLGVPRFFEKLHARIQEARRDTSGLKRRLLEWALKVGQARTSCAAAGRPLPASLSWQHNLAQALVFRKLQAKLGGRLRFFVSGGAPLSKEIGEFFYSVGATILEGYGLTETSPVIAVNHPPTPRFGSVGQPLPGVEVSIAEDGEILTRGPHVMQGYYRNPDVTAHVIIDGWFHTGDIGHLDPEGYLFITDRKKDLIKTAGGKFVAPQKLENLLLTDPYITQAFVYGDRRPYCVALIVPHSEQLRRYAQAQGIAARTPQDLLNDERIQSFYWSRVQIKQQGLANFEQVKKIALLDQEFSQASGELTPTLKAKRNIIAQRYGSLLQSLYEPSGA